MKIKTVLFMLLLGFITPVVADYFDDAAKAWHSGDYATAAKLYRSLAARGHTKAQYWLGHMYKSGKGVPQDYAEAVKWYRKAAEQGHAEAQNNLGWMYTKGWGLPQDYAEAVRWYSKSAKQGNAWAQYSLGRMYHYGRGVVQDYTVAYIWYNIAAASGYENSIKERDNLAASMTPAALSKGQRLARECVAKYYKNCP